MLWYFEETRIALINGHPNTSCLYDGEGGRFRDRLKVDYETGSLIITNITTEHSGRYEAEIIRTALSDQVKTDEEPRMKKREFDLDSGLSSAAVAGICAAVLLVTVVAAAGVIYSRRKFFRNAERETNKYEGIMTT